MLKVTRHVPALTEPTFQWTRYVGVGGIHNKLINTYAMGPMVG